MSKPTENALNAANALLAMGFLRNLKPEHMREAASIIDKHFPQLEPVYGIWYQGSYETGCWVSRDVGIPLFGPRGPIQYVLSKQYDTTWFRLAIFGPNGEPIFEEAVSDGD